MIFNVFTENLNCGKFEWRKTKNVPTYHFCCCILLGNFNLSDQKLVMKQRHNNNAFLRNVSKGRQKVICNIPI